MDLLPYKRYLENKHLDSQKITDALALLERFAVFLTNKGTSLENVGYDDIHQFSKSILIPQEQNTYQNYAYLLYYGYQTGNHGVIIAVMDTLDGWEMFPNFEKQLLEKYGQSVRDEIFQDLTLPPQGIHPKEKPPIIQALVSRFIAKFGPEESTAFFEVGLRDKYVDSYKAPRENFLANPNIDTALKSKHQNLVATLEKHLQANTIFFTQPVTQEVVDFVKGDQQISAGIREGDRIFMYKIPYMTDAALSATEKRERNYYICHNPLIREALLEEDEPISPIFCNCSGGFMKNYWEAVLDHPVEVELLESVITGGEFCKFAIHLPAAMIQKPSSP